MQLAVLLAGVCTALLLLVGQASAVHVQCGDSITQDTTLDSDLVDCPEGGIGIAADGVTLDLNRHSIIGQGERAGVSTVGPHNGVTIENGSVSGFAAGVFLAADTSDSAVRGLRLHANTSGIALFQADRNAFDSNRITGSTNSAISLFDSSENLVTKNRVDGGHLGIDLFGGEGNVVTDNFVSGITVGGIRIGFTRTAVVERNSSSESGAGILVFPEEATVGTTLLRDNLVRRNGDGIYVRPPFFPIAGRPNVTLTANTAIRNADLGIEAMPGVVDGGGNKAAANGNPLQCLNIVCK